MNDGPSRPCTSSANVMSPQVNPVGNTSINTVIKDDGFPLPSFTLKQHKRRGNRKKRDFIKENGDSSTLREALEPGRNIFVYRVDAEAGCELLKEYLGTKSLDVRDITLMSRDEARFKFFKVTLPASQLTVAFDCSTCPEGVCVRRFFTP